jgi:alpha-galactosidase
VDAGWYWRGENVWWDNVGDWVCGEWIEGDLHPLIESVRGDSLRFGLWMEPEAAGNRSAVAREHPEWLIHRGEEALPRALDLSREDVADWVEGQIAAVISRYRLDMFRIDHNNWLEQGGYRIVDGIRENVMYRYFEHLYALLRRLKAAFPSVSFQNCAAGGGRLDYGILRFFDHTEISDWTRPPRAQRCFAGVLTALPPEICLRIFGVEFPEHALEGNLSFQLHTVLGGRPAFRGIAPSQKELSPALEQRICQSVALFKNKLRPILVGSRVFLHTPPEGLSAESPWTVIEYARPDKTAAYALLFKLTDSQEEGFVLRFRGLSRHARYRVTIDSERESFLADGEELVSRGLSIRLPGPLQSELVLAEEV